MSKSVELRQERAALVKQMTDMVSGAESEKRNLTSDEQQKWDKINVDVDSMKERIDRIERGEALEHELKEVRSGSLTAPNQPFTGATRSSAELNKQSEERHTAACNKYLRYGDTSGMNEYRALESSLEGTGNSGAGYTIPTGFHNKIIDIQKSFSGVPNISAVTFLNTSTGNDLPLIIGDDVSGGQIGVQKAENDAMGEDTDPTFDAKILKSYTFTSDIVLVPFELLEDQAVDLESYLALKLGQRLGRAIAPLAWNGDGVATIEGVVNDVTNHVTTASATDVSWGELVDLEGAIDPAYLDRTQCRYGFNSLTLSKLKKKTDTTGRPLWTPGIAAGEPDQINGYGYDLIQNAGNMTANSISMLFGNFSYYYWRTVGTTRVLRLTEAYAKNLQVGFAAYSRVDGKNSNPAAFAKLVQHS